MVGVEWDRRVWGVWGLYTSGLVKRGEVPLIRSTDTGKLIYTVSMICKIACYMVDGMSCKYIYTVINILAFRYQFRNGFSPFFVSVSSIYAHRCTKSSWLMTCVSLPVVARYTSSMTLKLVGKNMSKYPWWTWFGQHSSIVQGGNLQMVSTRPLVVSCSGSVRPANSSREQHQEAC